MAMAGSEFLDKFFYFVNAWWPARAIVEKSLKKRFEVFKAYVLIFRIFLNILLIIR